MKTALWWTDTDVRASFRCVTKLVRSVEVAATKPPMILGSALGLVSPLLGCAPWRCRRFGGDVDSSDGLGSSTTAPRLCADQGGSDGFTPPSSI